MRFETRQLETGRYEVRLSYTPHSNRASSVPVVISHADGETKRTVNQKKRPEIQGLFHSLGTFSYEAGKPAVVVVSNKGTDGYVIIDAVQWIPVGKPSGRK